MTGGASLADSLQYKPLFKFAIPVPGFYQGFTSSNLPSETTEALFIDYMPLPLIPTEDHFEAIYQPTDALSIIFQKSSQQSLIEEFGLKVNFTKRF
jgi:hypothetical protein